MEFGKKDKSHELCKHSLISIMMRGFSFSSFTSKQFIRSWISLFPHEKVMEFYCPLGAGTLSQSQ